MVAFFGSRNSMEQKDHDKRKKRKRSAGSIKKTKEEKFTEWFYKSNQSNQLSSE